MRLLVLSIVGTIINLLFTLFLLIIRPLVKVKILNVSSDRLGHLAFSTDYFLRKIQLEKDDDDNYADVHLADCYLQKNNLVYECQEYQTLDESMQTLNMSPVCRKLVQPYKRGLGT